MAYYDPKRRRFVSEGPLAPIEDDNVHGLLRRGWDLESWADDILGVNEPSDGRPPKHRTRLYSERHLMRPDLVAHRATAMAFGDGMEAVGRGPGGGMKVYDLEG